MVEHWFRSCKSLLRTRPIYHKCDETIRGHVFCSFLALVLRQELQARLEERGHELEWTDVIQDLDRLQMVEVEQDGKRFLLRTEAQGTCGKVFQAVGVALPPVQQVSPTTQGGTLPVPRGIVPIWAETVDFKLTLWNTRSKRLDRVGVDLKSGIADRIHTQEAHPCSRYRSRPGSPMPQRA